VLGIREGKEGWFHVICPSSAACSDDGSLWASIVRPRTTNNSNDKDQIIFFYFYWIVEDVVGLLLSPQSVFGIDDETGGRLPTAGPTGSLVCPGNFVPHARMEFT
jgi:hypothetical protein